MSERWRNIWENRRLDPARGSLLAQLMAADGLDSPFSEVSEADWRAFVRSVATRLGASPGESVFEVGCGAGAFLRVLHEEGCSVGGLDASQALTTLAREALPGAPIIHAEASALDPNERWDHVVSCGVFLYFPSTAYAERGIDAMTRVARHGIALLDLLDQNHEVAAREARRGEMGQTEYEARYAGLSHLAFDRGWVAKQLEARGFTRLEVQDQWLAGYGNARFRFNVIARRP